MQYLKENLTKEEWIFMGICFVFLFMVLYLDL